MTRARRFTLAGLIAAAVVALAWPERRRRAHWWR